MIYEQEDVTNAIAMRHGLMQKTLIPLRHPKDLSLVCSNNHNVSTLGYFFVLKKSKTQVIFSKLSLGMRILMIPSLNAT